MPSLKQWRCVCTVIQRKTCGSPCMCLLLAKRLWFFVHSEKTLLFLPLPRSRPPQIIGNILSIANSFWIRHSGSYSAAALLWGEHGLCKANIWQPYPCNHKLNPTSCRRCNNTNKTGCFSSSPSIAFCTKEISYVLGRIQFFWDLFENQFCGHCQLSAANSMRILPNLKYSLISQWHIFSLRQSFILLHKYSALITAFGFSLGLLVGVVWFFCYKI